MTVTRAAKRALILVGRRARHAPESSSSTRKASSLLRLEATGDSDTNIWERFHKQNDGSTGLVEVSRAGTGHPLQDFVSENDASNFMVTWPLQKEGVDGLTRRMLNSLDDIRQRIPIHVTPAFNVLDGRGDKMASLCVVSTTNKINEPDSWASPREWTNQYAAINQ